MQRNQQGEEVPFINVKLIEDAFTPSRSAGSSPNSPMR
jgi:hypothetical protein